MTARRGATERSVDDFNCRKSGARLQRIQAEGLLQNRTSDQRSTAMTTRFRWTRVHTLALTAAALTVIGGGLASAQTPDPQPSPPAAQERTESMGRGMMAGGQKKLMMAEADAMDRRLSELVAKMNAAEGPAKMEAIAAVVNELVATHTKMRRMMTMMAGTDSQVGAGPDAAEHDVNTSAPHAH
jgi:hypothetical protein